MRTQLYDVIEFVTSQQKSHESSIINIACYSPRPFSNPHLSVTDEGRHRGQARLNALMPRQHIFLIAVQELIQNPEQTKNKNMQNSKKTVVCPIITCNVEAS